ncbi:MAG: 30S ribosomal protein S9 [bacterium]
MSETTEKKYIGAVGRRKTAIARVRLQPATKSSLTINDKSVEEYFKTDMLRHTATEAITKLKLDQKFAITVVVSGGGISGQAVAVRHSIARALNEYDADLRKKLKKAGFLERDQRSKERRKFGLKKARKAPQWSKR